MRLSGEADVPLSIASEIAVLAGRSPAATARARADLLKPQRQRDSEPASRGAPRAPLFLPLPFGPVKSA